MEESLIPYYFEDAAACPVPFGSAKFPWELLAEKDTFLKEKRFESPIEPHPYVVVSGYVEIGLGTTIAPFTVIEGPVVIGENCTIRSNALIRPGTVIGNDVVVGHGAELKNTLIMSEAKIQGQTFVGDSVVGRGARLGTGVITGNRRFDQKAVRVKIKEETFELETEKFGCIIGDFVRIGMDVSLTPGVCVGKFSWVYPHMLVNNFVPKESFLKLEQTTQTVPKEKVVLKHKDAEGKI